MRAKVSIYVRATAMLASVGLLSACLRSTDAQPSQLDLAGTWKYTGVQTGPVREDLSGTLAISLESGSSFQGRLDLVAVNSQTRQSTVYSGAVSGAEASNIVDFDANLETRRRHVGQLVADTIAGTWVGTLPDGTMNSGTFRVERVR
jgi:hypothetical protein